jgi:DNA-binding transcriptional LysR family regulator
VISKLIKDLERELGAALFHRNAKQVSLTDFGAAFLTDADQVVTLFNNLSDNAASKFQLPKGKVAIGLPLSVLAGWGLAT